MKRVLFIAWNLLLALGVGFSLAFAIVAQRRAIEASNWASNGASIMATTLASSDRTAILRGVWSTYEGTVEVKGSVARPGIFRTSVNQPLSVARLVEMAGGAAQDSKGLVLWKFANTEAEGYITLADAIQNQEDFNTMPAPGSVLTVK